MLLFVGLGNPGTQHARNRHNVGFMAVDEIARRHGFGPFRSRFQGLAAEGRIAGEKIIALEPLTYMNRSGQSVAEAVRFYKLAPEDVTVFYDEIDLAGGKLRVKRGGGHAGHNGLRDITNHIGADFRRVRIGVGHPGDKDKVAGYVLHDFAKAEMDGVDKLIDAIAREIDYLVRDDDASFMSRVSMAVNPAAPKPKDQTKNKNKNKKEESAD